MAHAAKSSRGKLAEITGLRKRGSSNNFRRIGPADKRKKVHFDGTPHDGYTQSMIIGAGSRKRFLLFVGLLFVAVNPLAADPTDDFFKSPPVHRIKIEISP